MAEVMPAADAKKACHCAERLRHKVEQASLKLDNGDALHMTVSIGVAQCLPGWGLEELLAASDRALYSAKNGGRNQVVTSEGGAPQA